MRFCVWSFVFCLAISAQADQVCRELFALENPALLSQESLLVQKLEVDHESFWALRSLVGASQKLDILNSRSSQIHQFLSENVSASLLNSVKTLIYPAAGYDASTPFIMLPQLKEVVAIDQHPFVDPNFSGALRLSLPMESSEYFTHVGQVDVASSQSGLAGAIVARLAMSLPGFRLQSIFAVKGPQGESHGWLEFDLGAGTPLRRYIHVQHQIPAKGPESAWLESLREQGFQALLIKGSMNSFLPDSQEGVGALPLLDHLRVWGGLLIDADGAAAEVRQKAHPLLWQGELPVSDHVLHATGVRLGYSASQESRENLGVKILEYKAFLN